MTNYLAVATVTATLQRVLQQALEVDLPGIVVTTEHPGDNGEGIPDKRVNLYLYQAIPNSVRQKADPRNHRKEDSIKNSQVALDLFYLLSFYGEEKQLEPQRFMGSAVRTIIDNPFLTPHMIQETMSQSDYNFLLDSTLDQQVDKISVVPTDLSKEELAKIWSLYFQPPYVLSFAISASAILIKGNKSGGRALPVRKIATYSTPNSPRISHVVSADGVFQPIHSSSLLTIRGEKFRSEHLQIKIGDAKLSPQKVESVEIKLDLSELSQLERASLRAGIQSLQLLHPTELLAKSSPLKMAGSNVVPFVLVPKVMSVEVTKIEENLERLYAAIVKVELDLIVGVGQRVFLFLNERSTSMEAAYIFSAEPRSDDSNIVTFTVNDVKRGEYLVRVQIDGAESPIDVDTQVGSQTFEQYIRPAIAIA